MSKEKNKVKKQEQMVERMGVHFEKSGFTPMHGRVFAYLLLAEPPYKDFYEIQNFLKASKSAISNALKFLMDKGMVSYITFSGDRKRYFRVDTEGWLNAIKETILRTAVLQKLVKDVLDSRSDSKHLDFNQELEQMTDFFQRLDETLLTFMNKWEEENK